jgi:hypothetical protein
MATGVEIMGPKQAPVCRLSARRTNASAALGWLTIAIAALVLPVTITNAQNAIVVGSIQLDPPTYCCLGIWLPITSGDDNYNARAAISYRQPGGMWKSGLPLLRVRPDTVPYGFGSSLQEQFAGSIFDLRPGTDYEIQLEITDPDGGSVTLAATASTRRLPPDDPASPRAIAVDSLGEWQAALNAALPGDVIEVAEGTYNGALTVTRSGTADNPIFVRGARRDGTVLNAAGSQHGIVVHDAGSGSPVRHVIFEDFTVRGSTWGMRILGADNVVVQHMALREVDHGINATTYVESERRAYPNTNLTICDNVLEGDSLPWPFFETAAFNVEGIVIEGSGHVVCHNVLSGFGDSLGIEICYGGLEPSYCPLYPPPHRTTVRNRAIDFYGNDVLWGGDDGIELDFAERNVRAFRNRISNTGMGVSFQVIWGGPVYANRNIIYNVASRVFKLNNEPSGFYLLHNTSIRNGIAWDQPSPTQVIQNMKMFNNVLIGSAGAGALSMRTTLVMDTATNNIVEMNHNGWFPNGPFGFLSSNFGSSSYANIDELAAETPLEHDGVALSAPIFQTAGHVLPTIAAPPRAPLSDVSLHASSNAIDRGIVLPNVNDGFTGGAPDLGVLEVGTSMPSYGPRPKNAVAPNPPADLRAQ